MAATQIEIVNLYLPVDAKAAEVDGGYGWTDEYIANLIDSLALPGPAYAVRYFWYQRTQETAEYLDAGKPLTQIHRQAKEMLAYWDLILKADPSGNSMVPLDPDEDDGLNPKHRLSFGEIERVGDTYS